MDQLSRDAKAAKAAGMSYGKWKGLQWERRQAAIAAERKAREEEKARRRAQREAAQAQAQEQEKFVAVGDQKKKKVFKVTPRFCARCGNVFYGKGTQKYCCEACKALRKAENVRQAKERQRAHNAAVLAATGKRYDLIWKRCVHCGAAFLGTRGQTLCGDDCRKARKKQQAAGASRRNAAKKAKGE